MIKTALMLAAALIAVPAQASQTEFWSADGYFVYHEDKSCALYIDYASGTTIRISDRRDEHNLYVSAYSEKWKNLSKISGESVTIGYEMPALKQQFMSPAIVFQNPDNRMGFSGSGFDLNFLDGMKRADKMYLNVAFGGEAISQIETFNLDGSTLAINKLNECSNRYFPR